ncbi:alpha-amylase/4-alpha-glucanotransferase domain-containing protein [Treponema phagedenis]|uniref:alpha-amylase/4-alpha-glucanotransferase domain-containing protein n=1 Tax=Treponema phagedenis TaxID=162 RepID=UPI0001F63D90|nr:alpha-amylase/4-alpha-glucanotransferase domain-containing protein [Treponema phagedenis]EFW38462.1 glycosyl hydrolase, family 57 [Treponema phagedenis F0421]TYT79023.1 DUF1926 domain-containing protein [Treponema phagedenis]
MPNNKEEDKVSIIKREKINLCFAAKLEFTYKQQILKEDPVQKHKLFFSNLCKHEKLPLSLHISGALADVLQKKESPYTYIINEMAGAKRLELLGGGFYQPYFPLLPSATVISQVEALTALLRKHFDKRPRGCFLEASAWAPSLISSFVKTGMEYCLLDHRLFKAESINGSEAVILEDNSKTIVALPYKDWRNSVITDTPEEFYQKLVSEYQNTPNSLVIIFLSIDNFNSLFQAKKEKKSWFDEFIGLTQSSNSAIKLTHTGEVYKNRQKMKTVYISANTVFEDEVLHKPIKQILTNDKDSFLLYAKMMFVYNMVTQIKGDRQRKTAVLHELHKGEGGELFALFDSQKKFAGSLFRHAYKNILMAEKQTRIPGVFSDSLIKFDFDFDGTKEFLSQRESMNMYVESLGGKIFEFDLFSSYKNYAFIPFHERGIFIDYLLSEQDMQLLRSGQTEALPVVFSDKIYRETGFDPQRHELSLKVDSSFERFDQPVSLKKQYSFKPDGVQVQYILKNEGPLNLSAYFAVEINIAVQFLGKIIPGFSVFAENKKSEFGISFETLDSISWMQIIDPDGKMEFTIQGNEAPNLITFPLKDRAATTERSDTDIRGIRCFFYWKIELNAGYETEKMIFLNACSKKEKSK